MRSSRLTTTAGLALLALLTLAGTPGCAADTDDDVDETEAAQTRNPAYDAVVNRAPKVETTASPGGAVSSETRLIGHVPNGQARKIAEKLLAVARWTEIRWDDGSPAFSRAQVGDDRSTETKRTIAARVDMPSSGSLDLRVVSEEQGGGFKISITNTSAVTALFSTVLQPGKLSIDVKVVPYERGVIVDARARVKLESFESRAPGLTSAIAPIFTWLKAR